MDIKHHFNVAIVGGGIGGLVTALSLATFNPGLKVDVYEQADRYKEIGAGVDIGINAARLLHKLGLGESATEIAGNRNGVWLSYRRWDNGGEIVTIPMDDSADIKQLPVRRSDFLEILLDAIKERKAATLHTGKRCIHIEDRGEMASIRFEDGTSTDASLVIACDGIHSAIRSFFATDKPEYSGRICYRGLVPISKLDQWWPLQSYSASWLGKNKHFLVFPICGKELLNIVAFVGAKPLGELGGLRESWTATASRAEVEEEYRGWDKTVVRVVELMDETPNKWILNDRKPLSKWVHMDGKVAILGDAAHAMLPHQGAGAGQAIEDAYILARAVQGYLKQQNASQAKWLQLYEDLRLPRTEKAQVTAREAGKVYQMQDEDMAGLDYEQCIPIVARKLKDRMKWIWGQDVDEEFTRASARLVDT